MNTLQAVINRELRWIKIRSLVSFLVSIGFQAGAFILVSITSHQGVLPSGMLLILALLVGYHCYLIAKWKSRVFSSLSDQTSGKMDPTVGQAKAKDAAIKCVIGLLLFIVTVGLSSGGSGIWRIHDREASILEWLSTTIACYFWILLLATAALEAILYFKIKKMSAS